jgi:hypothetical protein
VQGSNGHIYDYELVIEQSYKHNASHVATVDMRNILPRLFGHHKERQGHAMFCEFQSGDYVTLRNSWGSEHKHIQVHKDEPSLKLYYIHVKNFIWRGFRSREDIFIFKDFKHYLPKVSDDEVAGGFSDNEDSNYPYNTEFDRHGSSNDESRDYKSYSPEVSHYEDEHWSSDNEDDKYSYQPEYKSDKYGSKKDEFRDFKPYSPEVSHYKVDNWSSYNEDGKYSNNTEYKLDKNHSCKKVNGEWAMYKHSKVIYTGKKAEEKIRKFNTSPI